MSHINGPSAKDSAAQTIEADKVAFRAWVADQQKQPGRTGLKVRETKNRLTLIDDETGAVAAFVFGNGRWTLKWMRQNGRWAPYDDKSYRTLDVPMLLVDRDEYGCFWG